MKIDLKNELEKRNIVAGKFLDIVTGSRSQAKALADLGFDETGVDVSEQAVEKAKKTI